MAAHRRPECRDTPCPGPARPRPGSKAAASADPPRGRPGGRRLHRRIRGHLPQLRRSSRPGLLRGLAMASIPSRAAHDQGGPGGVYRAHRRLAPRLSLTGWGSRGPPPAGECRASPDETLPGAAQQLLDAREALARWRRSYPSIFRRRHVQNGCLGQAAGVTFVSSNSGRELHPLSAAREFWPSRIKGSQASNRRESTHRFRDTHEIETHIVRLRLMVDRATSLPQRLP